MQLTSTNMKPMLLLHFMHLFFLSIFALDALYPGQSISVSQTLTSRNGIFEFGCYYSNERYLDGIAIWFKKLPGYDIVWSRALELTRIEKVAMSIHGDLVAHDHKESVTIWSSRSSSSFNSTKLVLEENGNLVVRSISDSTNVLWQSFDHPTNTWLPGAKVGLFNKLTNTRQVYLSLSYDDLSLSHYDLSPSYDDLSPSYNNLSLHLETNKMSSISLKQDGSQYGTCRVKGISLSCSLNLTWYMGEVDILMYEGTKFSYVSNKNETYVTYTMANSSILSKFVLNEASLLLVQLVWSEEFQIWETSKVRLSDKYCDQFAVINRREHAHVSKGTCSKGNLFQCYGGENEGFVLFHNASLAFDKGSFQRLSSMGCNKACLHNYSCIAYYAQDGCVIWQDNLSDIQMIRYTRGWDIHVKLAVTKTKNHKFEIELMIVGAIVGGIILSVTSVILIRKCRRIRAISASKAETGSLTLFNYSDLRSATKNFTSKLGEGGFGFVYKGTLPNSTNDIAVKKLKAHCQGEKQFRAEVSTLGMIHHVNLVSLRGFCVEGAKRFLVYDHMPLGSLDKYIFGCNTNCTLDWRTRYQIVLGIAKGLAYLHQECRECIIHCDIKPENILLDAEFIPKLADFGLAKLLGRDFSRVLTTMRGTRGYMAPEWLSGTAITPKADVYSYGMMLFEIISGERNWSLSISGENDYFPLQAMQKLITEEAVSGLLDSNLEGNMNTEELFTILRVAGWCIQDDEKFRPSMIQIVQILEGVIKINTPPMPRFLQYIVDIQDNSQNLRSLSC